jgi:hypothetical protein
MKIFVLHDNDGKIRGTLAAMHDNVGARAMNDMHLHVLERETLDRAELNRYLHELHTTFKVEVGPAGTSLMKI